MNNKGFTLIEALVSISIFIAISVTLAQVITVSIQNQIKVVSEQNMFDQAVFVLDQMEKELRMAKKDTNGTCVTAETNFGGDGAKTTISFLVTDQTTGNPVCKSFSLSGGVIRQTVSGNAIPLTSSTVNIGRLQFDVVGDSASDNKQPKVTIRVKMSSNIIEDSEGVELQTTISQRRLDF